MPTNPLRKRGRVERAAKTARNLAIADTIYVFLRDRIATRLPGAKSKRRVLTKPRAIAVGATAASAAAGAAAVSRFRRSKAAAEPPAYTPPPAPTPTGGGDSAPTA